MNNFTNNYNMPEYITGIILLLIFLFIPLIKLEKFGISIIENQHKYKITKLQMSKMTEQNNSLKIEINTLQQKMMKSKSLINELMQQTYELNEEINTSFSDSLINKQKADSLDLFYNNKLSDNDHKIDSVSLKFNEQSDSLIIQIENYSNFTYNLNIQHENLMEQIYLFWYNIIFFIGYLLIMFFGIRKALTLIKPSK